MPDLELYVDPAAFLRDAGALLAADPVVATVASTVSHRIADADRRGEPRGDYPHWWLAVRECGDVVGVAMRTAPFEPYPLYVLPMPQEAARELARVLHARGEQVLAVNGALPAAQQVAEETARLVGGTAQVHERMRLWEATEVVTPPQPAGRLRAARAEDTDLATRWWNAFATDAAEQAGRSAESATGEYLEAREMARRVEEGLVWLWEDESGRVVHLTAHNPPTYGVARVGPVYTPRDARGHGYASAAVAAVTQRLLDTGAQACLFTDLDNSTSNKIYEAVGYRPVVDMVNLRID
ncbi:GNAT family N-acetyltransferase [Nocardioides sp. cx-169]|uniref:GNAT family N-acetyltransferase n=1 Tax=Nocardioides sp. cx-169 TaxID=2899080 RepID=UPI001E562F3A|nr:GNAT family N-acetyltransferase [Nocardioides sp. cx-169]MCD4535871.1 GNAT family N-acetyltransferase [Nocardioides sp. cx-169]